MALTLTSATIPGFKGQGRDAFNKLVSVRQITLASTYVTGGHAYIPTADFDLRVVELLEFLGPFRNGTAAVSAVWDPATGKIMFFSGAAEVAGAVSLAGYVGIVRATGY